MKTIAGPLYPLNQTRTKKIQQTSKAKLDSKQINSPINPMTTPIQSNKTMGFSLAELLVTTTVIGILLSIGTPNYLRQLTATNQKECAATMSTIMTSTMAFNDEFSKPPSGWADLNTMAAIRKENGTASGDPNFNTINLRNGHYSMSATISGSTFNFNCIPRDSANSNYDVIGCLNLNNGASEVRSGNKDNSATNVDCS